MTAGPFRWYDKGLLAIAAGGVDYLNDSIKCALLTDAHTPGVTTHEFLSDVVTHESEDGDYSRQTLASKTVTIVSGKVRLDAANINFGSDVTIAARYAVIFKDTANAATSQLLGIADLQTEGGNKASTNSEFRIELPNGHLEITPNPA